MSSTPTRLNTSEVVRIAAVIVEGGVCYEDCIVTSCTMKEDGKPSSKQSLIVLECTVRHFNGCMLGVVCQVEGQTTSMTTNIGVTVKSLFPAVSGNTESVVILKRARCEMIGRC